MDWTNPLIYVVGGIALLGTVWRLGVWMGSVNEFKTGVRPILDEIRNDIKKILNLLPSPVTATESPIKLSDLGRTISGELDADKWAEERVARFKNELKDKSPYEIQEFCFELAKGNTEYDPTLVANMQTSAYNHGLQVDQVKRVFAVELRDALLKNLELEPTV